MQQEHSIAEHLLSLDRSLRDCRSLREVLFLIVNKPRTFMNYRQAALWRHDPLGRPSVAAISGLTESEPSSPFSLWLIRVIGHLHPESAPSAGDQTGPRCVTSVDLPPELAGEWEEWNAEHALCLVLNDRDGHRIGGIWVSRPEPFQEGELTVWEWIASSAAYALLAWGGDRRHWRIRIGRHLGGWRAKTLIIGLLALLILPVPLTVVAPAEVSPRQPRPVTAPFDGVIQAILVEPNQEVTAGTPLAQLDGTVLRNRLELAKKALDVAQAEWERASQKSFVDEASRADLEVYRSRVEEKAAEAAYYQELLNRSVLKAPATGTALFASAEDWIGKPVATGERIMTIADPTKVELTIHVPVADAVGMEPGDAVSMFLNVSPLSALKGKIVQTSYEAGLTPEGAMAYTVQAELDPGETAPRVGLKGTAKLYSDRTPLGYYVLRKPLIWLRRTLGV